MTVASSARLRLVALFALCACSPTSPGGAPQITTARPSSPTAVAAASGAPSSDVTSRPLASAATAAGQGNPDGAGRIEHPSADKLEKWLFPAVIPAEAARCRGRSGGSETVRCLLALRYRADAKAAKLAQALFEQGGHIAGLEAKHRMNGGWRGKIQIVPELPIGRHRRFLSWILSASEDFDSFFEKLESEASGPLAYRHRRLRLRFFRSVGRTTPSAYASGWSVAFNVSGSLHRNAEAVRETLFHEIFHLNDDARGDWSGRVLTPLYRRIIARCTRAGGRLSSPCLAPYAPHATMVRGGTYYAFQPGNGVVEYAAELSIAYYRAQREVFAGRPPAKAFKCGPSPNAEAWRLLADEFFGGVDRTPPC